MSVADPPETERLSARLRAATRADHDVAQGSGFLDALAGGRLPRDAYADLAAQHWFVYETLEQAALAMIDDPVAGEFALPATEAYRDRLRQVAFDRPSAFIAHHYTRYLGDLSGGQYLGPAIARAYGLDGDGHRFFVFDGVRPPAFRTRYRELLDGIRWAPGEEDAFLAEV